MALNPYGYTLAASDVDAVEQIVLAMGGGLITSYTAAELLAMETAGTLTPLATYVASDASPPYQLWALDASTLGSPLGCDLVSVQYAGSTGATIEVLP